jgi:hypothetical protein
VPQPVVSPAPPAPLFTDRQVLVAGLLGTPIAAGIVLARNFARAGRSRSAQALPVVAAVLVITTALVLDATVTTWAPWLAVPFAALGAVAWNRALLAAPAAPEGSSGAVASMIALVWIALILSAQVLARLGVDVPRLRELAFDVAAGAHAGEVRFEGGASREDSRRVRDALDRAGYLEWGLQVTVSRDDVLVVSVLVPSDASRADLGRVQRVVAAVAAFIAPRECVLGRAVDEAGTVRASGRVCP